MEQWTEVDVPTHPLTNAKWVDVAAEIRNNATGVVRDYRTIAILYDAEDAPSDFPWRDGNNGCDCNRALFFAQSDGDPDPDRPCGEGRYSVRVRNPLTGRVFYDEFQP